MWDISTWDSSALYLETSRSSAELGLQPHVSFVRINSTIAVAAYKGGEYQKHHHRAVQRLTVAAAVDIHCEVQIGTLLASNLNALVGSTNPLPLKFLLCHPKSEMPVFQFQHCVEGRNHFGSMVVNPVLSKLSKLVHLKRQT